MRLEDIVVDEVSLVDKAANKRTFCFVKRDETATVSKQETTQENKVAKVEPIVAPPAAAVVPVPEPTAQEWAPSDAEKQLIDSIASVINEVAEKLKK